MTTEERQFRRLHKIVNDCSSIPLLSQLETSTAEIDVPDASGWTPLMWATFRHNAESIQHLLDYDADANLLNNEGQHALHLGAWSWNPNKSDISQEVAAWQRLVSEIPDVDLVDRYYWTPLMYAAGTARDVPLLEALAEAGADVNLCGHAGTSPLHWATQVNRADAVRYLVQKGADLGALTIHGKTPLHLAIVNNSHDSLQVLLDVGVDSLAALPEELARSLLLDIARHADMAAFEILSDAGLPFNVPVGEVRDDDGKTLLEVFDHVHERSPNADLLMAWHDFLDSIGDNWHDAVDEKKDFYECQKDLPG